MALEHAPNPESAPLSALTRSLAAAVHETPTGEKTLVVPNHAVAREILASLGRTGIGWLNLRAATPLGLALEAAAAALADGGLQLAEPRQLEVLAARAYDAAPKTYFPLDPPVGLVRAVGRSLAELRLAAVTPDALEALPAPWGAKGADLSAMARAFTGLLDEHRLVDAAGVFGLALGEATSLPGRLLVPESLRVEGVVRAFLTRLGGDSPALLGEDPVCGLPVPPNRWGASEPTAPSHRCRLYAPETDREDPQVELFAAVGERSEVREVLRRVLATGAPFDEVEIALADYRGYAPVLDDLRHEVPGLQLTFGYGLPWHRAGPPRVLAGLARWMAEDYPEPTLRRLLEAGDVTTPEGVSPRQVARLLRRALIGAGRLRYQERLDAEANALEHRLRDLADDDEKRPWLEAKVEPLRLARRQVAALLEAIPEDGATRGDYRRAALALVAHHAAVRGEADAAARTQLVSVLSCPDPDDDRPVSRQEAAAEWERVATGVSVGRGSSRPGCAHVTSIEGAGRGGRPRLYVLGLDERRFPGTTHDDPVLGDGERRALGAGLALSAERSRDATYRFAELVARSRGRLCLSYSSYDLQDGRRCFPAAALLQTYRFSTGNPGASYEHLEKALGEAVGFVPGATPLTDSEWWFSRIRQGSLLADGRDSVLEAFPDLARGEVARRARQGRRACAHDGKLDPDPVFDPRANPALTFSPTRLETYPACPRAYFLRYLLKISPPDEAVLEPGRWLDAAQRGTLLHDVYCRLLSRLAEGGEAVDPPTHGPLAAQILDQVVERTRQEVPPPSEAVFHSEVRELRRSVEIFVQTEAESAALRTPSYFETSFGLDGDEGISSPEPVSIRVPGGELRLRGAIDRIDRRRSDGAWEVWDYKTGGTWGYRPSGFLDHGRHLQHALYAAVAERLLRAAGERGARVAEAGYLFPTEKGEGARLARDQSRRSEALEAAGTLFDAMGQGVFLATGDNCRFCDYVAVCDGSEEARWQQLLAQQDPGVQRVQEVRDHD